MFITKKHLPRRTFLRSALGAVVAMPFVDTHCPYTTNLASMQDMGLTMT